MFAIRAGARSCEVPDMTGTAETLATGINRDTELARLAARRISEYLTAHPGTGPVAVQGELAGGDVLAVPREAAVLLAKILGHLANGEGVEVVPDTVEFTVQEAADFLGVSRPRLIELLDDGHIGYRRVGTHRRIRFQDLREYKARDGRHPVPVAG